MRDVLQTAATIRGLGCALALTVSVLALSGCVTAAKETASAEDQAVPEVASADSAQAGPGAYEDQQVVAVGANAQQQSGYPAQANAMVPAEANGQPASLTMQSTGLKATSNSIFATQAQNANATGEHAPLPVGQATGVNPATNSLFNSGQPATAPVVLPLEGASNTEGTAQAAQQVASAEPGADTTPLPVAVPIPSSAASAGTAHSAVAVLPDSGNVPDDGDKTDGTEKSLTLAGLFAAKRKSRNQFNDDRFAKAPAKKTLAAANMKQQQIAALGFTALPGVRTTSMFATTDDSQPGHDDDSDAVEMASLPGLARLAPNGLWLQTEKVETGCFQPELLQVLKVVENHYGRKVMVTSGLRDLKHNASAGGSRHSLHTTCQAADIQVPGVGKWDLAAYLRTIPGRGGVGTYCHTESVHIDIGEERDWNWRCRRRRG